MITLHLSALRLFGPRAEMRRLAWDDEPSVASRIELQLGTGPESPRPPFIPANSLGYWLNEHKRSHFCAYTCMLRMLGVVGP